MTYPIDRTARTLVVMASPEAIVSYSVTSSMVAHPSVSLTYSTPPELNIK